MSKTMLAVLSLALLAACGGGDRSKAAAADSLSRDLQLVPMDSSAALGDQPAAEAPPVATNPAPEPAPAPKPKPAAAAPKPKPAPEPAAPAPAPAPPALEAGATIYARVTDTISSRTNKAGDVVTAEVTRNVTDSRGRVVIPAGSQVALKITAIKESENKSDKTGTLTLAANDITVGGRTYVLSARIDSVATRLQGRGTNAGDVAKVGAGTAIGAVVGRVIGGSTKGAVIGGVIGGAVGTQRAIETKDRDVVVPAGSVIKLTLTERFAAE